MSIEERLKQAENLLCEAAIIFRQYQNTHEKKALESLANYKSSMTKAMANKEYAERIEAFLKND